MTYLKLLVTTIVFMSIVACAAKDSSLNTAALDQGENASKEAQVVKSVLLDNILPWHKALEDSLIILHDQSQRFCRQPSEAVFNELKNAWFYAMGRWSSLAAINFGPIDDTNASWRFQFWPDPLNYVHRKFKSRLQGYNQAISKEELASASIAIQGLSAMEYLLFDELNQSDGFYAVSSAPCRILEGTAYNLMSEGKKLNSAWQNNYKDAWMLSLNDTKIQEKHKHYLEDIFNGILTNLTMIKEKKLGAPLGLKIESDIQKNKRRLKPKYLESWRSFSSLQHLQSNISSMELLYLKPFGFSWYLNHRGDRTKLDTEIKQQFVALNQTLKAMHQSAFQQISEHNTKSLDELYIQVSELFTLLRVDYMQALNLHFRFNALDGD